MFKNLFKPKPAPPDPGKIAKTYLKNLGLTQNQALALRSLTAEPGWTALLTALETIISERAEEMLQIEENATLHFYRGRLIGLKEVPNLVDEILANLEKATEADARSREQAERAGDSTRVSTYGTPGWERPAR